MVDYQRWYWDSSGAHIRNSERESLVLTLTEQVAGSWSLIWSSESGNAWFFEHEVARLRFRFEERRTRQSSARIKSRVRPIDFDSETASQTATSSVTVSEQTICGLPINNRIQLNQW
jgi:hypothetical protein